MTLQFSSTNIDTTFIFFLVQFATWLHIQESEGKMYSNFTAGQNYIYGKVQVAESEQKPDEKDQQSSFALSGVPLACSGNGLAD